MAAKSDQAVAVPDAGKPPSPGAGTDILATLRAKLSFANIGAVYVWIVVIIFFSVWKPQVFPKYLTVASILNDNAVIGIVALALIVPLAAGVFDLSVGFTLGASSIMVAWLLGHGWSASTAILMTMLMALGIGIGNAVVVVLLKVDSFIGTLATGSLLQAVILAVSGNQQLTNGVEKIQFLGFKAVNHITLPVFVLFGIAVVLWYFLEHTALGRFVYATGLGKEQARLAGVRTEALQFGSLVASALTAGAAGVLVTGIVGAGSPTIGPPYLIPAFAGAFLGATQLRDGLFNAWGTIIGVLLLGTTNAGLALANVPLWTPFVFNGTVLIAALALRGVQTRRLGHREMDRRARAQEAAAEAAVLAGR